MRLGVISFNIRCVDDTNGNSIAERAPRLFDVTSIYDADVICFQEYTPTWKPLIEKYYSSEYDIYNKYRTKFTKRESEPILWKKDKFKRKDKGYFWLSDTPHIQSRGWDEKYNCFRICEYVVLTEIKSSTCFTVMNTHFGFGDDGQVKSSKLIFDYSKKISCHPTIVTGDFNMTPSDIAYKAMTDNFTDANIIKDYSPTYHGYNKTNSNLKHIDYIFADSPIVPVTHKIITELSGNKYPSDHYGVYAELEI